MRQGRPYWHEAARRRPAGRRPGARGRGNGGGAALRLPWQTGGGAEEAQWPTHEESLEASRKWNVDARAWARAGERRCEAARVRAGRAGAGHPFWDKKIVVEAGNKKRRRPEKTTTARRILGSVLTAPDGYTVGFDGFTVKTLGGRRVCSGNDGFDKAFHVRFGRTLVAKDATASYCGVFADGRWLGAVAHAGPESGMDAHKIVRRIARAGGGRPDRGGNKSFAQAGGLDESRGDKVKTAALEVVVK